MPCMKKYSVQFHQIKTLKVTFDKQEKIASLVSNATSTMLSKKINETFDRTLCLNYMMEVYYMHCIYSYPNYHNYMYYTAYNYPQIYIFFLIDDISKQQRKQREHLHPFTLSKSHLSVPLLQVLTLRNSGSWSCL